MDEPQSTLSRLRHLDWRVWLGLVFTFAWLILGIIYLETNVGWDKFSKLGVATLGSFLEGAFAPLAFLWLVVGYFLQKDGLERNTEAIGDDEKRYALFYGTDVRARHSNNLIYYFERLLARAREVDQDGLICDSLLTSAHGFVYRLAKRHQSAAPPELADGERTGRYIVF
jgi:hypothetical protein